MEKLQIRAVATKGFLEGLTRQPDKLLWLSGIWLRDDWVQRPDNEMLVDVTLSPTRADVGSIGQEPKEQPDYEAIFIAIRREIQGHIESHISSPSWEEVLGKIVRIEEAAKHTPRPDEGTKPEEKKK